MAPSQTPLWLSLGVIFGAAYSLSADHYSRAQTHNHLYVRAAMLGLSCATWLASASAIGFICYRIRLQNPNGLDGLERMFSVLIPVVVRADLIVDWGKRVTWLLFLAPTWTQSCVSLRRIMRRAGEMAPLLDVDADVEAIARGGGATEDDFTADMVKVEDAVWGDGAESLVRISEILEHMRKLSRVSIYAAVGFVGAVPGAVVWVGYAAYKGVHAWRKSLRRLAILYWVSVVFSPIGTVVVMFVSAFAFVGIVSLSVVGALVAFAVHWSTRLVYSVLRMGLVQLWADFPFLMRREGAVASLIANAERIQTHVIELPGQIGKQVVELPGIVGKQVKELPGHLEALGEHIGSRVERVSRHAVSDFAARHSPPPPPPPALSTSELGSGEVADEVLIRIGKEGVGLNPARSEMPGGDVDAAEAMAGEGGDRSCAGYKGGTRGRWTGRSRRRTGSGPQPDSDSSTSISDHSEDEIGLYHGMALERHPDEAGAAIGHIGSLLPTELEFALASWDGATLRQGNLRVLARARRTVSAASHDGLDETASPASMSMLGDLEDGPASSTHSCRALRGSERRDLRYMARLGMDNKVNTPVKRRLTTYYCLGMLAQLQSSSGGNSWLVRRSALKCPAVTDVDHFVATIAGMRSNVALEAAEACLEVGDRLFSTPKYRTVPSSGRNVDVGSWLRAVLLTILGDPGKVPAWAAGSFDILPDATESGLPSKPGRPLDSFGDIPSTDCETHTNPLRSMSSGSGGAYGMSALRTAWTSPLSSTESGPGGAVRC